MNKQDLINAVAEKSELSKKDSTKAVDAVIESIMEGLVEDGKVAVMGFGNWTVRNRAARDGINPQTQEKIRIEATKTVGFKPSKNLKDVVKNS